MPIVCLFHPTTKPIMDTTPDTSLLENFFSLHAPDLRKKVRIVTPAILGQEHLLHISKDANIKVFTPNVTRRAAHKEDRSVARVCVAPSLVACMYGYSSILWEYGNDLNQSYYSGDKTVKWNGGWTIYGIPYKVALFPSEQLVPRGPDSDEHWLVTTDKDTSHFKPVVFGEFYLESSVQVHVRGKKQTTVEIWVKVTHPDGLFLDKQHHIAPGCWVARVRDFDTANGVAGRNTLDLTQISEKEYTTRRQLSLSAESRRPISATW